MTGRRENHSRNRFRFATHQSGFTLLEVLVATVIMGTAVTALISLLSGSLGNVEKLRVTEQARILGQSQLNELLTTGAGAGRGTASDLVLDQKMEGRWDDQFRWEALATRFRSSPQPVPGEMILVRVGLDVYWESRSGDATERKLSLETYQVRREPAKATP